jgi:hypothetical protein
MGNKTYIIELPITEEVYSGLLDLRRAPTEELSEVLMRAASVYKFVRGIEDQGGEVRLKIKGKPQSKLKIP